MSCLSHASHRWIALPAAGLLCLCVLAAGPATQQAVDPQRVSLAIAQLGDADPAIRERATLLLWSIGKPAETALDEAAKSGEAEIALRARQIAGDIKVGLRPNDLPQIIAAVHDYRRSTPMEKREIVLQLMNLKAYAVLARLCTVETSDTVRGEISRQLSQKVAEAVPALVARSDLATAEQWLDVGLMDSSDGSARAYVMYYLLRGQADAKIAQLQGQGDAAYAARALALMHQARGELAKARQVAEKAHEEDCLEDVLLEQGDWKALAGRIQQSVGDEADLERAGFLTTYYRLAGNEDEFRRSLDLVRRYEGTKDPAAKVAHILVLNDRPQEGIDLLTKHGLTSSVFGWLWMQRRFNEALDAIKSGKAAGDDAMLAQKALSLHLLGRKQEAGAIFDDLARRNAGEPLDLLNLAQAEVQCDRIDAAFDHAAEALRISGQSDVILMAFRSLFPDQDGSAVTWWNYFRTSFPQDSPKQTLARVRKLLRHELGAAEYPAAVQHAVGFARGMQARDRGRFLGLLASTLFAAGQEKLGQGVLKEATDAKCRNVTLGELAAVRKDWPLAADLYANGEAMDPETAVGGALRGYCLIQAGKKQEGRKLIDKANLLILADGRQRCELGEALERIGLNDEAMEQYQLVMRTAPFFSGEEATASYQVAELAEKRGDYDLAASSAQRLALHALRSDTQFTRSREYLLLPHQIHRYRAAALLKSGKVDEALKEIDLAQAILPGDIQLVIDVMPLLEKAGRKKEADALFEKAYAFQQKLCGDYPDSPLVRNEMAWLLVRCRRHLDQALVHAAKGVELAPTSTAIIDTLAEVHFQLGQKQQAIELMKKCIELEPGVVRNRLALKRLEELPPESAPIE